MIETFPCVEQPRYEEIAAKDPLDLDERLGSLPLCNHEGDTAAIQEWLTDSSLRLADQPLHSADVAFAALRDLDFLAASLIRHGINPIETTPYLEENLLSLSRTTGSVPRGTVYTYAAANPTGERQRTFTGTFEEDTFIDAVRSGMLGLDTASNALSHLELQGATVDNVQHSVHETVKALDRMTTAIVAVHRHVSPDFFTHQLRPYFEPLIIGNQSFSGAGGAQMQLLAIDRMLWGIDDPDPVYREFYDESYPYLTPVQKEGLARFERLNDGTSLLSHALRAGDSEIAAACLDAMRSIRRFRYPHKKVADDNFKLRSETAVGSGSYRPDILGHLIAKTEVYIAQLEEVHEDRL